MTRRIAALFRPYRGRLAAVLGLIVVSAGLGMVSPFLLRDVLDVAIPENDDSLLIALVAGMIGIAVATGVLSAAYRRFLEHDLRRTFAGSGARTPPLSTNPPTTSTRSCCMRTGCGHGKLLRTSSSASSRTVSPRQGPTPPQSGVVDPAMDLVHLSRVVLDGLASGDDDPNDYLKSYYSSYGVGVTDVTAPGRPEGRQNPHGP